MGLALVMPLRVYSSMVKRFKLRARKFWTLISTFVEVTGVGLVGGMEESWTGLSHWLSIVFVVKFWQKVGYLHDGWYSIRQESHFDPDSLQTQVLH